MRNSTKITNSLRVSEGKSINYTTLFAAVILFSGFFISNIAFAAISLSVIDPTDVGPVQNDTINITVTSATSTSFSGYGFSSDSVCNAVDSYPNPFLSGVDFTISGDYADYLCAVGTDLDGFVSYALAGKLNVDNTAPVILGVTDSVHYNSPVSVSFTDLNSVSATATDATSTFSILSGTTLEAESAYVIGATDSAGNATTKSFVVDNTAPVVTLIGSNPTVVERTNAYTELGASSLDNFDGDLSGSVVTTGTVDTSIAGNYTVQYSSTDTAGNTASTTRTVQVVDTVAPVGYTVAIDQALLNMYTSSAMSFTFTGAEVGTTYFYSVDDALASTSPITGTGSTTSSGQNVSGINVLSLQDGTVTLSVSLKDISGNQGATTTATVIKEAVAPVSSVSGISALWQKNDVVLTFNCPALDCSTIYYTSNGIVPTLASSFVAPSGTTTISAEGTSTIKFFAVDINGNQETVQTAANPVRIDKTIPTISIASPTGGYASSTTNIITNPVDLISGFAQVSIYRDGPTLIYQGPLSSATWNTALVTDGAHVLTAVALDVAGNYSATSTPVTVTVDNTAPVGALTFPLSTYYASSTVQMVATASDAGSGVAKVEFYQSTSSPVKIGEDTSPIYGVTWDTKSPMLSDGLRAVFIKIYDNAGNSSGYVSYQNVVVDHTAPTVTSAAYVNRQFSPNGDGSKDTTSIDFLFSEQVEANVDVYYYASTTKVDDLYYSASVTNPVAKIWDGRNASFNLVPDGDYAYVVSLTDLAGNTYATSTAYFVTKDTVIPTASLNFPNNNTWVNSDQTVNFNVADDRTGLANVSYCEGTTSCTTATSSDTTSPYQALYTTTTFINKTYRFWSVDNAGNSSNASNYTVKIDKVAPVGSITLPMAGAHLMGTTTINANVTDPQSGVNKVEFWHSSVVGVKIGESTTTPYTTRWNTKDSVDGPHNLYLIATDNVNNVSSQIGTISIIVDNTPPVITLLGASTTELFVKETYTDAGATALDGIDGDITSSIVVNNPVNTMISGTYTVTYDVTDLAGNKATQVTRTVVVKPLGSGPFELVLGGGGGGGGFVSNPQAPLTAGQVIKSLSNSAGQVLGASTYKFTKNLKIGSRGQEVTELQNRLKAEGLYSGTATGYYGTLTSKAVKAYQKKNGITQTGTVGPQTRAKLNG